MSVSESWVSVRENQAHVLKLYRDRRLLSMQAIAEEMCTTTHNVQFVIRNGMAEAERKALASVRKSAAKMGSKNPMKGKTGKKHPNFKGECEDGHGYLTCLHEGRRVFVHRLVMAKALGLKTLPRKFDVHHIDNNPKNNDLDNLALVTRAGHQQIHYLQVKDTVSLALKRSTLVEAVRSMTSQ